MTCRIGVALYSEFRGSLESFLDFLTKMGVDYVEMGKDWVPTRKELGQIRDLLEIYQIGATLHIQDHLNIASLDWKEWRRNILGVLGDLSVCYDLGIGSAVLHCGWVPRPEELAKGYERFKEAYEIISNFAIDLDVKIGLENQFRQESQNYIFESHEDVGRLENILEFCDPNNIFFVLDVGHVGRSGTSQDKMVSRMNDRLLEVHLHDFDTNPARDHLPLGAGQLDLKKILKVIEERKPLVTIENKSVKDIRRSISFLRDKDTERVLSFS